MLVYIYTYICLNIFCRWWVETGLDKMSFARDRLLEHYFWCNGMVWGQEFSAYRDMGTKILSVMTTIDDVYDVYGSLEELELFTDYVDRLIYLLIFVIFFPCTTN